MKVLMVAEKPSVAEAIARALSRGKYDANRDGGVPVFTFTGNFEKKNANYYVTSTKGHILSTDLAPEFQDWKSTDATELFEARIIKKVESRDVVHNLERLCGQHHFDALVLWLDCDREGENICFEVIDIVHRVSGTKINISRVRFSSLVENDLRQAFETKRIAPNKNESDSVDARQELDLKVGVALTRFFTKYVLDRFTSLDSKLVSYGPCQLPTLWFLVNRYREIESFKPQTYNEIDVNASLGAAAAEGGAVRLRWQGGKIFDSGSAHKMKSWLETFPKARVLTKRKVEKRLGAPTPLNTVAMLKKASTELGMSPHRAMDVAEQLYLMGLVTYPRTESTKYAAAFNLEALAQDLTASPFAGNRFHELLRDGALTRPARGVDMGDHPPLTPCPKATAAGLAGEHAALYRCIENHFLLSIAPDAKYEDVIIQAELTDVRGRPAPGEQRLVANSRSLKNPGFMKYTARAEYEAPSTAAAVNKTIAAMEPQCLLDVHEIILVSGRTSAPGPLTEAGLLSLMEKNQIGTDASMAMHVNNIQTRNYAVLQAGRQLVPTKLGMALCNAIEQIDPELARPTVRRLIERQCYLVARGEMRKDAVIRNSLHEFAVKFQFILRKVDILDRVFELSFKDVGNSGKSFSRCGKCNRFMKLISRGACERLACVDCFTTIPLPPRAKFQVLGESFRCVYDNYEIILAIERGLKAYPFCPMCYDQSPYKEIDHMRCIDAPNETLPFNKDYMKLGTCRDIFEVPNCPGIIYAQEWPGCLPLIVCSHCDLVISFKKESVIKAYKLQGGGQCESCGTCKIGLKINKSKEELKGCLFCDEDLQKHVSDSARLQTAHKKRGKFRGRPRGGPAGGRY